MQIQDHGNPYTWLEQKSRLATTPRIWENAQHPLDTMGILGKVNDPKTRISDQQLGIFDDRVKLIGGAALATMATLGLTKRVLGIGEFLGFIGFFGAMVATPKIINAMVQARTGLNMNRDFISSNGERRWMFQDPQYMPLHLLPDRDIEKIGDRLNIPTNLENRRRVIEDRIRQVTSQSLTWWMLMAGPATPVLGSMFAHFTEGPIKGLFNQSMQQYHQAWLKLFPKRADIQASHLQKLVDQLVGKKPEAELSRWWEQFANGVVRNSGLDNALSTRKLMALSSDELLTTIAQHFDKVGNDPAVMNKLAEFLKQEEARLTRLEKKGQTLVKRYQANNPGAKTHLQFLKERIRTGHATIAHYETLLQELSRQDKPAIKVIKSLMNSSRIAEIERLINNGHHREAQKLCGNGPIFKTVKDLIRNGQFEKAVQALGDSPANHLQTSMKNFMRRKLWRKRVLWGIGGTLLVLSSLYTLFGLARGKKNASVETLTGKEMRSRYASERYNTHQKELAMLRRLNQQMATRPVMYPQGKLKSLFHKNQAVIYALNLRTFGAHDQDRDGKIELNQGESGTFLSSIARLDELKQLGVNTIHLLPLNPIGVLKQKGVAGSLYAPSSLLQLSSDYDTPGNQLNVFEEARRFVDEAHKRGINVMVDIPSAASIDLAITRPDLIATDRTGHTLTPTNWSDIVMFENNPELVEYYQRFFDLMVNKLGVDGFRVDVARARPIWFWKHFIDQYPKHAWLAETYTYEDASPLANVPRDNPLDLLKAGFDSIYGQLHIFHNMHTATEYHTYLLEASRMFKLASGYGKSLIGSFLTHDDEETIMDHGGVINSNLVSGLMATQPYTNPYILDGFTTGFQHRIDIFNYKKAPRGRHPEIGQFLDKMLDLRKEYADILTTGSYIPVPVQSGNDQVIAFARQSGNKTLLVVANKDVNARSHGTLYIPSLSERKPLTNLAPEYGQPSQFKVQPNNQGVDVNLGPGRFHMFEIDTPLLGYYLQTYS